MFNKGAVEYEIYLLYVCLKYWLSSEWQIRDISMKGKCRRRIKNVIEIIF